jgi:hypothetical protein
MPSTIEDFSTIAAVGSFAASIWIALFARRHHEIRGASLDLSNDVQIEQYWGLNYLEFFYFNQRDIPESIYGLWMVELAALFSNQPEVWVSHEKCLLRFAGSFAEMYKFFRGINEAAIRDKNVSVARDRAVLDWVRDWPVLGSAGGASPHHQA